MIKLHDYQIECIETIADHFKKSDRQIIQLPTGSGKTFIFLNFLKKYAKSAIILCPSIELQEQIHSWGSHFLGKENIEKGWNKINCPFHVMTLASLNYETIYNKVLKNKFDYIILDEAHHGCAPTFIKFLDRLKNHKFKLLGVTATPERLDDKNLLDIFETLTYSKNILEMIELNHLCDIESYKIKTNLELKFISHSNDFSLKNLQLLDIERRNQILLNTFVQECSDKKTLIFCLNINHAKKISEAINKLGYSSEYIHGKMKFHERQQILKRFKNGQTMVLTNCQILTEGFDEPSIEALILARPTRSKSLYCQMIGRGVRKFPRKDRCYLYELTDNNHKICTFNVLGGLSSDIQYDYPKALRLSELIKEIQSIDFEKLLLEKTPHELFEMEYEARSSLDFPCFTRQVEKIKKYLPHEVLLYDLSFIEAEFLLFKQKLKVKYGYI